MAYYGTLAIEGLSAPGNHYSAFVAKYLNYPSALRASLLQGCRFFLGLLGYKVELFDTYYAGMAGGSVVKLVYSCLGVGVMSFWLAFVAANKGAMLKKLIWIVGGLLFIWLINILRISLVLLSANKHTKMPFNLDNHTFFNILAYTAIFLLMFFYDRSFKKTKSSINS